MLHSGENSPSRLARRNSFPGKFHELFDGTHMGRSPVPLEYFPNLAPFTCGSRWYRNNAGVGEMGSSRAIFTVGLVQQSIGNCDLLLRGDPGTTGEQ